MGRALIRMLLPQIVRNKSRTKNQGTGKNRVCLCLEAVSWKGRYNVLQFFFSRSREICYSKGMCATKHTYVPKLCWDSYFALQSSWAIIIARQWKFFPFVFWFNIAVVSRHIYPSHLSALFLNPKRLFSSGLSDMRYVTTKGKWAYHTSNTHVPNYQVCK